MPARGETFGLKILAMAFVRYHVGATPERRWRGLPPMPDVTAKFSTVLRHHRAGRALALVGSVVIGCMVSGHPVCAQIAGQSPKLADKPAPAMDVFDIASIRQAVRAWLARSGQEYQDTVVRTLTVPTGRGALWRV
jgi:hypothetical protein